MIALRRTMALLLVLLLAEYGNADNEAASPQSTLTPDDKDAAPAPLRESPSRRSDVRIVLVALQPIPIFNTPD